jgi:hypothetical protein
MVFPSGDTSKFIQVPSVVEKEMGVYAVGGWATFHLSWAFAPKVRAQKTEIHSFFMFQKYTKKRWNGKERRLHIGRMG